MVEKKLLLGVAIIAILVGSVIAGFYLLRAPGPGSSSSSSQRGASTTSQADPLANFGRQNTLVTVGSSPYGVAYDTALGETLVAVSGSDYVTIIDGQSTVVGNVSLGASADFLAYDASNSLVYASLIGSNSIAVINATLRTVVSSIPIGTGPGWLAYDPASATIYSVNREANVVSVISGTTITKNITLSGLPFAVAYDPADKGMYVTNNDGTVFVINATSNVLAGNIQAGGASSNLLGIAYNPSDQHIYATSYTDGKVFIIGGSQVTGSISGFDEPIGIAFSGTSDEMFVANSGNGTASAYWQGHTSTVTVGPDPREVILMASSSAIVVTDYGGSTVSVVGA